MLKSKMKDFHVYLPLRIARRIEILARKNFRSTNNEIICLLMQALNEGIYWHKIQDRKRAKESEG